MPFALDYIHNAICSRLYNMSFAPDCIQNVLCSRLYTEYMSFAPDRMSFALDCIQNVLCSMQNAFAADCIQNVLCCRQNVLCPRLPKRQSLVAQTSHRSGGWRRRGGGVHLYVSICGTPRRGWRTHCEIMLSQIVLISFTSSKHSRQSRETLASPL